MSKTHRGRTAWPIALTESSVPFLFQIGIPILGIVGSSDPSIEEMKELKKLLPVIDLKIIEGVTHGSPTGSHRQAEFAEYIHKFTTFHSK